IRVAYTDDGVVSDDILHRDRRITDLHYFSVKRTRRKRVDGKIDRLPDFDRTDIGLGHVRVDLHFGEIIRDLKNHRRLQTGRDGLANIDTSRNYHAIDRRRDSAMVEI